MQDLVDVHIFSQAAAILEGLARQDCSAALAWCAAHRARLRKIRSKLEFMLRIQVCEPWRSPVRFGSLSKMVTANVQPESASRGTSPLKNALRSRVCSTGMH
jgi:hypothetical protein